MTTPEYTLVDRRHRNRLPRPVPSPEMAGWVESYVIWLAGNGKKPKTIEIYSDAAIRCGGWMHENDRAHDWEKVTKDHMLAYMTWLLATYARAYANNQHRALSGFFKWLLAEENIPNPLVGIQQPTIDETVVPVIDDADLKRIIDDAENVSTAGMSDARRDAVRFESRRDAAIIRFLMCTGVRLAECATLEVDKLDIKGREAFVVGKAGRQRVVKFDQKCANALDRYRRERTKHRQADSPRWWLGTRNRGALTPDGVGNIIERRGQKLGIHIYPHMFRHTFSHRWLDAGGAEGDLMELAGWESPEMIRRYGKSAASARARRAYDRIDVMKGI